MRNQPLPLEKKLKTQIHSPLRNRLPLFLLLAVYFTGSLVLYRDFGMTFDEPSVYARGLGLAHYLVHDAYPGFLHKSVPDDGLVVYDHLYGAILSALNPSANIDVYHWLNMALASLLLIAAFEMLLAQYGKPWAALGGPLFILLTPRFLGDIPGNPKDMPFAVFYFLSLAGIYFFSKNPKSNPVWKILALGALFGLAQCVRLLGLSLYGVYVLFDFHFFRLEKKRTARDWRIHLLESSGLLAIIFMISNLMMVASWPYLGANYFKHLGEALAFSRHFFWDNPVLFFGSSISSMDLPLTYLPAWIAVTTPLFILFFAGASFVSVRSPFKNRLFILLLSALGLNLSLVLILRPVLYDGLRHFLFLLPLLAFLAALGALEWFQGPLFPKTRKVALGLVLLNILLVGWHLCRLHPYEYVYFNEFIGGLRGSEGKLDNDYWGASFKEAVDWLQANETGDPSKTYWVNGSGNPYQLFYYFKDNVKWTDNLKGADYFISTTRDGKDKVVDRSKVIHVVEREGVPLCYVFKLK